jgi:hypothetical protein
MVIFTPFLGAQDGDFPEFDQKLKLRCGFLPARKMLNSLLELREEYPYL